MVMSKIHSFCDCHLTQHEDTLHLSLLWTTSYKATNWRTVTFKLAAILDLKVKTRSNCKADIKKMNSLTPKTPETIYYTAVSAKNYWKAIFQDGLRWPFWIFANYDLCPHFWERHPLQFHSLTFKEDKNTKKQTFALHGHGSAPDDPTNSEAASNTKSCWLPRTGISSGTLRSVIKYGLPFFS